MPKVKMNYPMNIALSVKHPAKIDAVNPTAKATSNMPNLFIF